MKPKKRKEISEETSRVAVNFRKLRKARKWTQSELGKKVDPPVSCQQISNIEKGVVGLGKRSRIKYAKVFNVDVSEFLLPLIITEKDAEIALLKEEVEKYSAKKIAKIRKAIADLAIHLGGNGDDENGKEINGKNHKKTSTKK